MGISIVSLLLVGLGVFDIFYSFVGSESLMMPLTFGYAGITWILAILAIATGVGLWQLRKWSYWMAAILVCAEIVLASLDILLAYSGHWERTLLDMGISLEDIGYTQQELILETVLGNLFFYVICGLFFLAVWKMKPLLFLEPIDVFLNYLKLYKRVSIQEMAQRTGITEVDVELFANDLVSKGELVELDLQTRELTYMGERDVVPSEEEAAETGIPSEKGTE